MNPQQTPDNCPYCGSKPYSADDGYSCGTEVVPEWGLSRTGTCYQNQIFQQKNEVARLREELDRSKEMVMDAARRGDEMAAHWKERAEKAEALVKQIHHYAGIIEGFQTK